MSLTPENVRRSACSKTPESASPPSPRRPFGFGKNKKPEAAVEEEEDDEDSPYNPVEALSGIFGSKVGDPHLKIQSSSPQLL